MRKSILLVDVCGFSKGSGGGLGVEKFGNPRLQSQFECNIDILNEFLTL